MSAAKRSMLSIAFLLMLGASPAVHAVTDEDLMRARAHFDVGNGLYELGKYREAVAEFAAGYALAHKPRFLLNLGQCYRKLNDVENARKLYEQYVAEAPVSDPARAQALQILEQLPSAAPVTTPATALAPATVESTPTRATVADARKPSFVRRHWWIFPTAAVVLAGVATGIYFAVRPTEATSCGASSDLACFTFGR